MFPQCTKGSFKKTHIIALGTASFPVSVPFVTSLVWLVWCEQMWWASYWPTSLFFQSLSKSLLPSLRHNKGAIGKWWLHLRTWTSAGSLGGLVVPLWVGLPTFQCSWTQLPEMYHIFFGIFVSGLLACAEVRYNHNRLVYFMSALWGRTGLSEEVTCWLSRRLYCSTGSLLMTWVCLALWVPSEDFKQHEWRQTFSMNLCH